MAMRRRVAGDYQKIVRVEVDRKGTGVTVGRSLMTGNGCTGEQGRAISSGKLERIAVQSTGGFHGTTQPWRGCQGVQY